jgi:hypothetical protein
VRAQMDDGTDGAVPVADELRTAVLGCGSSPLTALEGTAALLEMDRNEVGTPLGDLEALSPR